MKVRMLMKDIFTEEDVSAKRQNALVVQSGLSPLILD
jgi:hypothetical protein